MSIYNSSVKTHIIDPVYSRTNFRAEYRLEPETMYLSNWRLLNVGCVTDAGGQSYNGLVGALGVIKHISLYDDNQLLDQVLEAPMWLGFKAVNNSNQECMDLELNLRCNRNGGALTGRDTGTDMDTTRLKLNEWRVNTTTVGRNNGATVGSRGMLRLKEVFPLLNNMDAIPTTTFKNLKVVVEYSTDTDEFMRETNGANLSTTEPVLVVDEVVGDKGVEKFGKFKGVSYASIEHDRVNVPAFVVDTDYSNANPNPLVQRTLHINGFNNKTVGRCLMLKSPTLLTTYKDGTTNFRVGKLGSYANMGEALQCRINGSSLFAGRGLTTPAQRQAIMTDTWGQCAIPTFGASAGFVQADGADRDERYFGGDTDIGNLDYWGWSVNDKVQDFQIDYDRRANYLFTTATVPPDAGNKAANDAQSALSRFNQAIDINLYCEVFKSIVPVGDSYEVIYQ